MIGSEVPWSLARLQSERIQIRVPAYPGHQIRSRPVSARGEVQSRGVELKVWVKYSFSFDPVWVKASRGSGSSLNEFRSGFLRILSGKSGPVLIQVVVGLEAAGLGWRSGSSSVKSGSKSSVGRDRTTDGQVSDGRSATLELPCQ